MMTCEFPSFDDWVAYCFTFGYTDFCDYDHAQGDDLQTIMERETRFAIPNRRLTEYAIQLFSNPGFIADRYNDQEIADATWFIFGVGSSYFHNFREKDVPIEMQATLMRSVGTVYTKLFDQVCNKRGTEPDGDFGRCFPIDGAVGMIWDMHCISGPMYFPTEWPHLIDPAFDALEDALFKCQTASCKGSALHGLGHIQPEHSRRVEDMIDRFLELPDQPEHLRSYARDARKGHVM